jgi:hypothetical protein
LRREPGRATLPVKHLLIAVPTMAGLMKAKTATTLVMLMRQLTRAGIEADYLNIDSSDITYARNTYAREVLNSKSLDGLLFVDSDMQFRPALVMKMLALDADVVGAAYPKRALNLEKYSAAVAAAADGGPAARAKALANAYQFTVLPSWDNPNLGRFQIRRGFARMAGIGMGCTLIRRAALQAMVDGKVVEPRRDIIDGVHHLGWGFFDSVRLGDIALSEDFSFCYRWNKQLGRDIWVCLDEAVGHLGEYSHEARYLDRLDFVTAPAADAPAPDPSAIELDADLLTGADRQP